MSCYCGFLMYIIAYFIWIKFSNQSLEQTVYISLFRGVSSKNLGKAEQ